MAHTVLTNKEVAEMDVLDKKEVVVAGGGPAGLAAAIAAARNDADVVLVEKYGFLGGMASTGLPFLTFHNSEGEQLIKGIAQEIVERLVERGGSLGHLDVHLPFALADHRLPSTITPFDPEVMKEIALEMTQEEGVELLLHCLAVNAILEKDTVKGIVTESKSGTKSLLAARVIDATGDGDIAARAGAPYEKGRSKDGMMQSPSLMFMMGNVNLEVTREISSEEVAKLCLEANQNGELPASVNRVWLIPISENRVAVNGTRILEVNGTDVFDLTRAEIEGRKQLSKTIAFLRKRIPGFESAYLESTASHMGIRETRRILGEYVLTKEDIMQGRRFKDAIVRAFYPIDVHYPNGPGVRLIVPPNQGYDIPYRCLLPRGIENLLVAGRCISVTHEALASTRVMAICMALGQAAGTAMALSLKEGVSPRNLGISVLRQTLLKQRVFLMNDEYSSTISKKEEM